MVKGNYWKYVALLQKTECVEQLTPTRQYLAAVSVPKKRSRTLSPTAGRSWFKFVILNVISHIRFIALDLIIYELNTDFLAFLLITLQ